MVRFDVSVLNREPMWLKCGGGALISDFFAGFSAQP